MSDTAPEFAIARPSAPEGGFAAISKYNPHLWSAAQLRAIFVARQQELADLMQSLRSTPPTQVGQHVLLVGSRGMGKSTLMQRLALAVEDDAQLRAAWLPLRFPEEQYTVNTLGQFWANVLGSLADALERQGAPTTALDASAERIAQLPASQQSAAYLQAINQCADERGQRLLLLVDNTDLLLHNIGSKNHWALREVLQSNARLLWVGGSYQSLEANSHYHDAFLDFFQVLELRPLRLEEMQQALLALARTFGGESAESAMQTQLSANPERLPTLRQLSGGNPRTTVMLYELFSSGQAGQVRSDLESLLDNMTPLYKARLDTLADLPRKLLAHILEHWAPITLAQLAQASQVPKGSISPQLQRLELEGLIQKTKLQGTTRNGYQASERFFNIWYLMRLSPRRQRSRLGWLVEFMRLWFSGDELRDMAQGRLSRSRGDYGQTHDWEYDRALADALPPDHGARHALRWNLLKQLQDRRSDLAQIFELNGEDQDFKGAADYLQRLNRLPALLRRCPHAKTEEEKVRCVESVMGSLSIDLLDKEGLAEAAAGLSQAHYDEMIKLFTGEWLEFSELLGNEAAQKLRTLILAQDFFPDMPDSKLAYEQIRLSFTGQAESLIRFAYEQHFMRHQDDWTLQTLEWARNTLPKEAKIAFLSAWILHEKLSHYAEAEVSYRETIAHSSTRAYPKANLARLLWVQGRTPEALALQREVIEVAKTDEHDFRLQAHLCLGNQDLALNELHALVNAAREDRSNAFYQLKEQVRECTAMGLGERLAEWMTASNEAAFLQPFIQALYTLAGANDKLVDLPEEIQRMADEVVKMAGKKAKPAPQTPAT